MPTAESFQYHSPEDYNQKSLIYVFRQSLLSTIALLHGACAGCVFGYSSILLPQLQNQSLFVLSADEESWIVSIPTIAMIPATLLTGWAIEILGRNSMALISITINFLGWMTIYLSASYETLLLGRTLTGIFAGMGYSIFLTFMGEISHPKLRPIFLSFMPLGCTVGVFVCQLLGSFLQWKTVALCICAVPISNSIAMITTIRESHIWLINQKQLKKAYEAFIWYRGFSEESKNDFEQTLAKAQECKIGNFNEKVKECFSRTFLIPLGITSMAFTTYQFSGNIALLFYTSTIIGLMTDDTKTQNYSIVVLNILRILSTVFSCFLFRRFPVRSVLLWGGYQLDFSLLSLSLCLFLSNVYPNVQYFSAICLVLITYSVVCFAVSVGPIPAVLCGELFPPATRGIGGALSASVSFVSLFIVVKALPLMLANFKAWGTFLFFANCTFIGLTVLKFALPNTKNKTLTEIGEIYEKPCE